MALFKAVVWALIFLTKLRFPPGVSIATVSYVFARLRRHLGFLLLTPLPLSMRQQSMSPISMVAPQQFQMLCGAQLTSLSVYLNQGYFIPS